MRDFCVYNRTGHIGTSHFVHYGKVVLSSEVKNFIIGTSKTFIWRLFILFPLFEVSVIRGYTIYVYVSYISSPGSQQWAPLCGCEAAVSYDAD